MSQKMNLSEGRIDIGIILPIDKLRSIEISVPGRRQYRSNIDCLGENNERCVVSISAHDNGVRIATENSARLSSVMPLIVLERAKAGGAYEAIHDPVVVKGVTVGRTFHWRKSMDLLLPGDIRVFAHEGHLTLVNRVAIEDYVCCVSVAEMSPQCPASFLQAQTIAARSWALVNLRKKHFAEGFDICNDDCCQRYQGVSNITEKAWRSAMSTRGYVLMQNGSICDARYSKSCGGRTESAASVWRSLDKPYLIGRQDSKEEDSSAVLDSDEAYLRWRNRPSQAFCSPAYCSEEKLAGYLGIVDEVACYFRWELKISQAELSQRLGRVLTPPPASVVTLLGLQRGYSGRLLKIAVEYLDFEGVKHTAIIDGEFQIRRVLSDTFLFSSAFSIESKMYGVGAAPEEFVLKGSGWGHGVGLCQIGALGMALAGRSAEDILYHYFQPAVVAYIG